MRCLKHTSERIKAWFFLVADLRPNARTQHTILKFMSHRTTFLHSPLNRKLKADSHQLFTHFYKANHQILIKFLNTEKSPRNFSLFWRMKNRQEEFIELLAWKRKRERTAAATPAFICISMQNVDSIKKVWKLISFCSCRVL